MKLALVGVGAAGGRIVDRIHGCETATKRNFSGGNCLVFDTAEPDYEFEALPHDQYLAVGDAHPEVSEDGANGDVELATEVTKEELLDIRRALDFIEMHDLDGVLVVAGLGGGTGSGMGSVLLDEFQTLFEKPVYALGVLPSEDEGGGPALNAARSLQSFVSTADNVLLFDNDAWCSSEKDAHVEYERANGVLASRITSLLATGERNNAKVPENAIDSSDIMRTLDTGGISSIGYASLEVNNEVNSLLSRVRTLLNKQEDVDPVEPTQMKRLVRQAVESNLTLPCNIRSAERTLVVLSGPSSKLSHRGFERARYWLEQETDTVELLAGDEPHEKSRELTAAVLLSNVTDVQRINAIQEQAVAHQRQEGIDSSIEFSSH